MSLPDHIKSTPLCSVLIPSRWRFDKLKESIKSVCDSARNPDGIEFIVRLHLSDAESCNRKSELFLLARSLTVIEGRDRYPHENNAMLWNDIRHLATGQWHQYWSDDLFLLGQEWDAKLACVSPVNFIAQPQIHKLNTSIYFEDRGGPAPFVPATAFAQYGFDILPDVPDASVNAVLVNKHGWNIAFLPGITVFHDRVADATLPQI